MDKNVRVPSAHGVYVLWLYLDKKQSITIGKLGTFQFSPGVYAYCGSAQRNLHQRLERHRRLEKKNHWHIDFFRAHALFLGAAIMLNQPKEGECRLVQELLKIPSSYYPLPGFGSSDCKCISHFIKIPIFRPKNRHN